tara:strand:+ start:142 stop:726 length:585 start_codon:yes stop_codon:yes gene_type:complete
MAIKIKIGDKVDATGKVQIDVSPSKQQVKETIRLKAKKSINGDIMIFDHNDIDIVLMMEKKKIVAFAKDSFGDHVYEAQDRLFKFLFRKGITSNESVQGGNVFYSMEAPILESKKYNALQHALYSIYKFMEIEKPEIEFEEAFEKEQEQRLADPLPGESTEFDPERHADQKGSIQTGKYPYGIGKYSAVYRLEE